MDLWRKSLRSLNNIWRCVKTPNSSVSFAATSFINREGGGTFLENRGGVF